MYVLKNAAKNLLRNKSRNLLIGIIMIVMMIAIAVSVIVQTATDKIITNYKSNFGAEVYINQNPEKIQAILNDGQNDAVPATDIMTEQSFAHSDFLKETKYTASMPTKLKNMRTVGEENENVTDADIQPGNGESTTRSNFNATLLGYSSNYELKEFKEGTRKVIKGEMPKKETDALISENLAELNQLKVGDDITLDTVMKDVSTKLTLHICGIYYDGTKDEDYPYMSAELRKNNEILTSADTVLSYAEEIATASGIDEDFIDYETTYILKNPDELSAFEKEVRAKGLPDIYSVSTDKITYDRIVKPVESVAGIARMFLGLVLLIGSLILIFLSTLAVRERKYEIGVLRAMGMKKKTVARGMIYESLILVAFCLMIGLYVGNAVSKPISKSLVQSQMQETQTENHNLGQNGTVFVDVGMDSGKEDETEENPLAHADVSLNAKAIAEIFYADQEMRKLDRDDYRARSIGVIFQNYNLLVNATALENIILSMNISGVKGVDKKRRALDLLKKVGIDEETAGRKILKLSGGEQQRVGIARALAHDPELLIADEPTGNLDPETEQVIMDLFKSLAHKENRCVIVVTHSKEVSGYADEIWGLNQGNLVFVK